MTRSGATIAIPNFAIYGLSNVRVVDASIIPRIPSTATNLTTIMVAERIFRRVYAH